MSVGLFIFASPKQTMTNSRAWLPEPNFPVGASVGLIYVSAEGYAQSASDLMIRRRRADPVHPRPDISSEVGNTIDPKRTLCLMACARQTLR